ncbi:hypothetical protein GM415_12205 [Pseudodesulfovibrio cashew]|uniref:Lipoprotein n=1 Tax=Pseudodesulfovibrio cashew TaxID=2678688 RepID=A0A6I6JL46_9BACT|nr:hypothetical protein [Pseudodesulfovibrio cashew]QGY40857.1 hypothetical protein GM415_12205 [Pseudodesulfovibrio cashew]
MFGIRILNTCLTMFILLTAGCGVFSGGGSGVEPSQTLALDDGFEFSVRIEKGKLLGLDMPLPNKGGYRITGASFDPSILGLVNFQESRDGGEPRLLYVFKTLQNGTTEVLFKMEKPGDGHEEIYKRATVNVGEKKGLF